jgi:hypothetical protein
MPASGAPSADAAPAKASSKLPPSKAKTNDKVVALLRMEASYRNCIPRSAEVEGDAR